MKCDRTRFVFGKGEPPASQLREREGERKRSCRDFSEQLLSSLNWYTGRTNLQAEISEISPKKQKIVTPFANVDPGLCNFLFPLSFITSCQCSSHCSKINKRNKYFPLSLRRLSGNKRPYSYFSLEDPAVVFTLDLLNWYNKY